MIFENKMKYAKNLLSANFVASIASSEFLIIIFLLKVLEIIIGIILLWKEKTTDSEFLHLLKIFIKEIIDNNDDNNFAEINGIEQFTILINFILFL